MSVHIFNPQTKTFYRPIDAAIRWCGLIRHEAEIIGANEVCPQALGKIFPKWPCLRAAIEAIYDAVRNGELPYGCLGISVPMGTDVENFQLTLRHSDFRHWMEVYYPDQKPAFLFESNSDSNEKIRLGTFLALQAERDALIKDLDTLQRHHQDILQDLQRIGLERDDLKTIVKNNGELSERSEHTYLSIIGALLNLFLDQSPAGKPLSVFKSQAAVVDAIVARYREISGLSKRTLDAKFAAANRSLKKSR